MQYRKHSRKEIKKRRLAGIRRKTIQSQLTKSSATKLFYDLLADMDTDQFNAGNYTVPQSKTVLRKAKSDWNLHDVQHKDPFTELCIVSEILNECEIEITKLGIRGYVQSITYSLVSVVMFTYQSLLAVKMNIQHGDGVLYIDATGSVAYLARNKRQHLLYYAMGIDEQGTAVPVLEFILDHRTTAAIVNTLMLYFSILRKLTKFCQPKRVELDFSWAIIHSILLVLNCSAIHVYIRYCYNVAMSSLAPNPDITVVHICAAHMMKAFWDNIRDKFSDKCIRQNALKAFALLQNSTEVPELDDIWRMIVVLFGTRVETASVSAALQRFKAMPMNTEVDEDETNADSDSSMRNEDEEAFLLIGRWCSGSDYVESGNYEDNNYFEPIVLEVLQNQYLPLVCLWSGLLVGDISRHMSNNDCDKLLTRDTNSTCESWFNVVKSSLLGKHGPQRIGLFVKTVYKDVKGRLREYLGDAELKGKETTPVPDTMHQATEGWRRK
ncbi:LOW QUALITY PROTEIN: hypothetical protein MAR_019893, partial [Mya arenaria]